MKTVEQAAMECADKYAVTPPTGIFIQNEVAGISCQSFKDGASWAQEWISVDEELPPVSDVDLLLKGIDDRGIAGIVDIGYMHAPGEDYTNFICGELIRVTHWRPIERK